MRANCEQDKRKDNISLRCAVNAPRYVWNRVTFRDLQQTLITDMMKIRTRNAKYGNLLNRQLQGLLDYDPWFVKRYERPKSQKLED